MAWNLCDSRMHNVFHYWPSSICQIHLPWKHENHLLYSPCCQKRSKIDNRHIVYPLSTPTMMEIDQTSYIGSGVDALCSPESLYFCRWGCIGPNIKYALLTESLCSGGYCQIWGRSPGSRCKYSIPRKVMSQIPLSLFCCCCSNWSKGKKNHLLLPKDLHFHLSHPFFFWRQNLFFSEWPFPLLLAIAICKIE